MQILVLDDHGTPVGKVINIALGGDRAITSITGAQILGSGQTEPPEIPLEPTAQDIVDALVLIGLVTQEEEAP